MNFISPEFLLGLPVVVWICQKLHGKMRWLFLLFVSYGCYVYWNGATVFLLLFATFFTYGMARMIEKKRSPIWVVLSCVVLFAILFFFKYAGLSLVLPVGISFYTFQTLSYVIDVYRGDTKAERDPGKYMLYVSFFPQLVAGPIERSTSLLGQIHRLGQADRTKQEKEQDLCYGMARILEGFLKKLVIADYFGRYVEQVYGRVETANGPMTVLATFLFAFQIYCDFSGYSDIAIGCARLLGIHLMENFDRPYLAKSFRDFWHRWHISLTSWFTDYVYKPLGGSRKGIFFTCVNILIVFSLSGIWHGAGWTFLIWGLLHGIFLVLERLTKRQDRVVTLLGVGAAWIFFRAGSVQDAMFLVKRLFHGWSVQGLTEMVSAMDLSVLFGIRVAASLFLLYRLPDWIKSCCDKPDDRKAYWSVFLSVILIGFAWIGLLNDHAASHFIYFQF